jgi:hypothetical protein
MWSLRILIIWMEKGFLSGTTSRSKMVFSKALWKRKEIKSARQDDSREWITVVVTQMGAL